MGNRIKTILYFLLITAAFSACRKAEEPEENQFDPRLSGGLNTVFDRTSRSYSHPFPSLTGQDAIEHEKGDAAFEQSFVSAPAAVNSGLGPIYNNVSCVSCHHNDGTGVPTAGESQSALLFRVSTPGANGDGSAIELSGYGNQLQDKAVYGRSPECNMHISYAPQITFYADGSSDTLWTPTYAMLNTYRSVQGGYDLSPRLAPPVFGLGLLEAVREDEMIENSDVSDADGDGISGKINYVWDAATKSRKAGRFGLKANTASILAQVAAAYNQDMGITNSVFSHESSFGQDQFDNLNDDIEIQDSTLKAVKFYIQTLAVPARRDVEDPVVKEGEEIFSSLSCGSCHRQTLHTKTDVAMSFMSNQRIHPYTDLLVHDMGEGLADHRSDFDADGREWRTTPLWGIGLRAVVNYPAFYLHDGRAHSIEQAILWHDGEARNSADKFKQLPKSERDKLMRFLKSL